MKYGFVTVASVVPEVRVADIEFNLLSIERNIVRAEEQGGEIICFPELCLTGYSCQDLFSSQLLLAKADEAMANLLEFTRKCEAVVIIGMPVFTGTFTLNCAIVVHKGSILGVVPKTYLPNYNEFYEKRWFVSAKELEPSEVTVAGIPIVVSSTPKVFVTDSGVKFGIEICEDVWSPIPPSCSLALSGADIIFNMSASNDLIGKHVYLKSLLSQQSARTISGYVYSSCGFGESTQDVVFGGNALIYENGHLLCESNRFSLDPQVICAQIDIDCLRAERRSNTTFATVSQKFRAEYILTKSINVKNFVFSRDINPLPFIPKGDEMKDSCEEIINIQTLGLVKRLIHTNCKHVVIGISGGLDSTLALLVCVRAFDMLKINRKGIIGVTMPGFGTTDRTHDNAISLMESLNVTYREIDIVESVKRHFLDIGHDINVHDVTYENSQARERTQILMDLSNQVGGLVIGTGDLSELALGWATYNGDHMSMYGVNVGVPKTLIRHLVRYVAMSGLDEKSYSILMDIIDTPISPELIPADENGDITQKTEDIVGPYELHDFFLYYFVRFGYGPKRIFFLAHKAFDGSHSEVGRYDDDVIRHWLYVFFRRFFSQQFKRSCLPDGPKVGSVSLSPRGDWRMPSDATAAIWLKECQEL